MKIAQILSAFLMASVAVSASAAKPLRLKKDNIHQVVQAMTLEEKARMVVGCSSSAFTGYGNSTLYVPGSAASTAMNERLGIRPTVLADGPAGLRISPTREGTEQTYYCTAFPIGTALASSWSTELVEQVGAADAVVCCWLPGQEGGNAVVDVMTGRENPSGKLTMTLSISYFDTNTYDNFPYDYTGPVAMGKYAITPRPERKNVHYISYEEGIYVGYRYYHTQQKQVSYPFGYGLSYTTFAYSDARVSAAADGGFEATVTVTNNGAVAGKEAVQLYVSAPAGGLDKPACELRSFGKTRLLQPGESETLTFKVGAYDLASYNPQSHRWETAEGEYVLHFAANVEDVRETVSIRLAGN